MTKENPYRPSVVDQSAVNKAAPKTGLTVVAVFLLLLGVFLAGSLLTWTTARPAPMTVPVQPTTVPNQP